MCCLESGVPAESGSLAASAVSDDQGQFTLTLPPGRYTITAAADGFVDASVIVAAAAASESHELMLRVAGVRETVDVNAPAGYEPPIVSSSTKTPTPLRDVPQSITVVTKALMRDQLMTSVTDVVRYVPGIVAHQGENNRDQLVIRGTSSSADFFLDGVRDDVQYDRDVYKTAAGP
jgi:catecholate siderophore receptor